MRRRKRYFGYRQVSGVSGEGEREGEEVNLHKKGVTLTHFHVYTLIAKWFYGLLKKVLKKGKIPLNFIFKEGEVSFVDLGFKEIDEWRERMIEREKLDREILNEVMKIVIEEYYKVYFFEDADEHR